MRPPKVSVIVPCYNVTPYVADALESLRSQTFRDFEIIVVNDGCPDTDNLERALEPYRDEIVYVKKPNGGLASARNAAILRSSAPLVALLDPDDVWEPDYLAVQVAMLEAAGDIAVVYPNASFFGEPPLGTSGKTFMDWFPSSGTTNLEGIVSGRCYVFVGVTARREELVRVGLFDETLRTCEDLDLWLRLAKAGARFAYHRRPLVRYRIRRTSLSSNRRALHTDRLTVLEKLAASPGLPTADRQAVEAAITRQKAEIDYLLGRIALYSQDRAEAIERLARCNRLLRRRKVGISLLALRYAPALLFRFIRYRYPTEASFLG